MISIKKLKHQFLKLQGGAAIFALPNNYSSTNNPAVDHKNRNIFLKKYMQELSKKKEQSNEKQIKITRSRSERKHKQMQENKFKKCRRNLKQRYSELPQQQLHRTKANTFKGNQKIFHRTCSNYSFKKSVNPVQSLQEHQIPNERYKQSDRKGSSSLSSLIKDKKKEQNRRSQSLLRKNRMFFNNFINQKKKQLDSADCELSPHINHIQNIRNASSMANNPEIQKQKSNENLSRLNRQRKRLKRMTDKKIHESWEKDEFCKMIIEPW